MAYVCPSRGCYSCRVRRKRSCMRCINAKRVCGGYGDAFQSFSVFHIYEPGNIQKELQLRSVARKCTILDLGTTSTEGFPLETSQEEGEQLALRAFIYDYCTKSANENLSRGYLSNLGAKNYRVGTRHDFVRACQAISFGSHGKPLRLFARTIRALPSEAQEDQILIAPLLGLYQMVMASETNRGDHVAHAKGLAAPTMAIYRLVSEAFSTLGCNSGDDVGRISLLLLKQECMDLDEHFLLWQSSREEGFQPTAIGRLHRYWPGSLDTYFDLYVAGVWNTYNESINKATGIAEDVAASVLCHVTNDLYSFLEEYPENNEIKHLGKSLGLLPMHPLYQYMQRCLLWIGSNMCIGQALVLALNSNIDAEYIISSTMVIWSGFLIQ
ncbi:putative C6 transcription factor [Trichoderma compactum]